MSKIEKQAKILSAIKELKSGEKITVETELSEVLNPGEIWRIHDKIFYFEGHFIGTDKELWMLIDYGNFHNLEGFVRDSLSYL